MEESNLVTIITGAGGGIGGATSVALAEAGHALVLVDRDEAALASISERVGNAGGRSIAVQADVSSAKDVQRYVDDALKEFGRIDGFFNNAGIEGAIGEIASFPEDEFDKVISVNLKGAFLGVRYVLPVMLAQGSGAIVNTASIAAHRGLPGSGAYALAKSGILGLTRVTATEGAAHGVRCNAISPGVINTRMLQSLASQFMPETPDAAMKAMSASVPMGRLGSPEDVANAVSFLLSSKASYITGVALTVDGGMTAALWNPGAA
jgi:NAD(P)-dependent dehydrogenase (short-subunit alcohol dehydrogenase family)